MFGPSCSRCALRSAFKTYSAHGWAQILGQRHVLIISSVRGRKRATDSQIIFPSVLFLLVHPLLRVLFPLLQILLPQWQHPRDQDFCKLLHKVGRDGQGRGAVPVAEHGFDEQESLNDQSCRIQGAQVICDPKARSGIPLRETDERRDIYL